MEIPRSSKELGIFFLGFFGSAAIILIALFALSQVQFAVGGPTGLATGGSNDGLVFGLFVLGVVAGLATVVKWKETA